MLAEINIKRNSFDIPVLNGLDKGIRKYLFLLQPVIAVFAGWMSFQSEVLNYPIYESQRFIAAIVLLCWVWKSVKTKKAAWLTLFGWYIGAASSIPASWQVFFGNAWGWVGLIAFSALMASPALLVPQRCLRFGLFPATAIAALSPIGMVTPWMASLALFPGFGWIGLVAALAILGLLPSIKREKDMVAVFIILAAFGTVMNMGLQIPKVSSVWPLSSYEGMQAVLVKDWFERQTRMTEKVTNDLDLGSKLVLTPEGTVDEWDAWSKLVWHTVNVKAGQQVLVGAYRKTPIGRQDGLVDITNGQFFPSSMPMIISMWHPWIKAEHYPIDFTYFDKTIQTPAGKAAYVICYEEFLIWPLAGKMIHGQPKLILSAANQWFSSEHGDTAQLRSINLQARLWGLPLVRAVNYRK